MEYTNSMVNWFISGLCLIAFILIGFAIWYILKGKWIDKDFRFDKW
jgi:hypothetical protein